MTAVLLVALGSTVGYIAARFDLLGAGDRPTRLHPFGQPLSHCRPLPAPYDQDEVEE